MQLSVNQKAPDFSITDVFGQAINLTKLRGQKIYLAFERNAGCPVCNLRIHELLKRAQEFKQKNIEVVLIYESTNAKMKEYLQGRDYPFHFVADPDNHLYKRYAVERSYYKLFASMFYGLMSKALKGNKLFSKPIKQDGHANTIPAEFLINAVGNIEIVHYGRFVGDHLLIDVILNK